MGKVLRDINRTEAKSLPLQLERLEARETNKLKMAVFDSAMMIQYLALSWGRCGG